MTLKPPLKLSNPSKKEKPPKKLLNLKLNYSRLKSKEQKNLMTSKPPRPNYYKLKRMKTKMLKLKL